MKLYDENSIEQFGHLSLEPEETSNRCHATVIIEASIVDAIYRELSLAQQEHAQPAGFGNHPPLNYIQQEYHIHLAEQVKEFLFKFFVINFFYKELRTRKILLAQEPRLIDIEIDTQGNMHVMFEITICPNIVMQEWKYLPFKAPRRKRYKDLDRQVEFFLAEEDEHLKQHQDTTIAIDDWVYFDIILADSHNKILLEQHQEPFWLKIGNEEADHPFQDLFLGKTIGETFFTKHEALQDYFNEQATSLFNFFITIKDIVPNAFVCSNQIKKQFRIKTNKELHQKIIEIFSYRNDISLRRNTIEEAYLLLLSRNSFSLSHSLMLRHQDLLLEMMQNNPDYMVYKTQKNFKHYIEKLAEKQIRESLITEQIAYDENLAISDEDVKNYLNLLKRSRTREFIYFQPPTSKSQGQELPLPAEELKTTCLREKALNYILYHLTKK